MSCFHAMFLFGPHSTGSGPLAWPCPVGPRNWGQASAWANEALDNTTATANRQRINRLLGSADRHDGPYYGNLATRWPGPTAVKPRLAQTIRGIAALCPGHPFTPA